MLRDFAARFERLDYYIIDNHKEVTYSGGASVVAWRVLMDNGDRKEIMKSKDNSSWPLAALLFNSEYFSAAFCPFQRPMADYFKPSVHALMHRAALINEIESEPEEGVAIYWKQDVGRQWSAYTDNIREFIDNRGYQELELQEKPDIFEHPPLDKKWTRASAVSLAYLIMVLATKWPDHTDHARMHIVKNVFKWSSERIARTKPKDLKAGCSYHRIQLFALRYYEKHSYRFHCKTLVLPELHQFSYQVVAYSFLRAVISALIYFGDKHFLDTMLRDAAKKASSIARRPSASWSFANHATNHHI